MKINKIRFEKDGAEAVLSPLESDVLKILWKKNTGKVRDIHSNLKSKRKVALTSIAVILDRLHQKNIVERKIVPGAGGGYYIYSVKTNRKEFERSIVESAVNGLIEKFGPLATNYFNERFSKERRQ